MILKILILYSVSHKILRTLDGENEQCQNITVNSFVFHVYTPLSYIRLAVCVCAKRLTKGYKKSLVHRDVPCRFSPGRLLANYLLFKHEHLMFIPEAM